MKNKKIIIIIAIIVIIAMAIGGFFIYKSTNKTEKTKDATNSENQENKKFLSNDNIDINGVYVNEGHINKEGLKQLVIFYTLKAGDTNLKISSKSLNLKVNDANTYNPTIETDTPDFTEYYYSEFLEEVYVGKTLNIAITFDVPDGDLTGDKEMVLEGNNDIAKGIKISTNDIKTKANYEEISQDIDPENYATKKAKEDDAMTPADANTVSKVQNAINDYYYTFPTYLGQAYITYKIEFSGPNNFKVSSYISGSSISNSGTYGVTKGYLLFTYSNGTEVSLKVPYSFNASGEVELENPFLSNGKDKIF